MNKEEKIELLEKQIAALQAKLEKLRAAPAVQPVPESPKLQERREAFELALRGGSKNEMLARGWSMTTIRGATLAADAFRQNPDWVMDFTRNAKLIPPQSRVYFQSAHVFMWKCFPERVRIHCASRDQQSPESPA